MQPDNSKPDEFVQAPESSYRLKRFIFEAVFLLVFSGLFVWGFMELSTIFPSVLDEILLGWVD